jgi:site-specific DNA recombinase
MYEGKIKFLFLLNLSRNVRNERVELEFKTACRDNGVKLCLDGGKWLDLDNEDDDFYYSIQSTFGRLEAKRKGRISRENKIKMVTTHKTWHGGVPPYGYALKDKKLIVDEKEAKWVIKIAKWYGEGKSGDEISSLLEGKVKPRRGGINSKGEYVGWSKGSIFSMMTNTHYAGYYIVFAQEKYKNEPFYKTKITCPRILDVEQYKKLHDRLEYLEKTFQLKNHNQMDGRDYILRGFLKCGHCGQRMGGTFNNKKESYVCIDRRLKWKEILYNRKHGKEDVGCKANRSISVEVTNETVWNVLVEVVKNSVLEREDFKEYTLDKGVRTQQDKKEIKKKLKQSIRES